MWDIFFFFTLNEFSWSMSIKVVSCDTNRNFYPNFETITTLITGTMLATYCLHCQLSIYPYVYPPAIYLLNYPAIYLSVNSNHLSIDQAVNLPTHLPIYLSIYLWIYLSTHLSILPSTHATPNVSIYRPIHPSNLTYFLSMCFSCGLIYPTNQL